MTNKEKIKKIKQWQNNKYEHPLTCNIDSLHDNLVPKEERGLVFLECPTCGNRQYFIPEYILECAS